MRDVFDYLREVAITVKDGAGIVNESGRAGVEYQDGTVGEIQAENIRFIDTPRLSTTPKKRTTFT